MRVRRLLAVCAGVLAVSGMAALPAQAETNPSCGSVTQIGTTAYLKVSGQTFASVKQFKGCGKNWGYAFVWESWRSAHPSTRYELCAAVAVGRTEPVDFRGTLRCTAVGRAVEVWSAGAATLSECTRAYGLSNIADDSVFTSLRC